MADCRRQRANTLYFLRSTYDDLIEDYEEMEDYLRDQMELELAAEPDPRFAHPDLPDLQLGRHRQHAPGGPSLGQGDGALDGHLFLQLHIQCIYVETDLFHIHGHDLP